MESGRRGFFKLLFGAAVVAPVAVEALKEQAPVAKSAASLPVVSEPVFVVPQAWHSCSLDVSFSVPMVRRSGGGWS